MEWSCTHSMTKEEFKKEILIGQKNQDLTLFLNTLHQIQSIG